MSARIGVDIGGTFTDFIFFDQDTGDLKIEKVPTTSGAPERGCLNAVDLALDRDDLARTGWFLNATTVGLNALLQRRGPTVGLIVTEGFRDILELRKGDRGGSYDLTWTPRPALVPRYLRLAVGERMSAAGQAIAPVPHGDLVNVLEQFQQAGVTSIAVCLMNAYANPVHELEIERGLRALGFDGTISLSHRISGEYGEYERTSTTAVDAFISPIMADYLNRLGAGLQERSFAGSMLITRSGGGAMTAEEAGTRAFETIMSGPVAGASGAAEFARAFELGGLITADVGGTSFDTCLITGGQPQIKYQGSVDGLPIKSTWMDVRSIGAGGGSLARVDAGGALTVGPQSAGAVPGPACYGRGGTEPTLTDATFALGMLGKGALASGLFLDADASKRALTAVGERLGLAADETARGIVRIAAAHMANAIREITIEKGVDPRQQSLFAFGGAGPMMATQLARELDMSTVIVPPHCGNFSAWGLLGADLVRTLSRTLLTRLDDAGLARADELVAEAVAQMRADAGDAESGAWEVGLDLRYVGQEHSLTIPVAVADARVAGSAETIAGQFVQSYQSTYGTQLSQPVEVVAVRTSLRRHVPRQISSTPPAAPKTPVTGTVRAWSFAAGAYLDFPLLDRAALAEGPVTPGPAIVLEPTATTYVDADFDISIESGFCMVLRRHASAA